MADYDLSTHTIVDVYRPQIDISEIPRSGNFGTLGTDRLIVRARGIEDITIGFERQPEFDLREAYVEWQRSDGGQTFFSLLHNNYRYEVRYEIPRIEDDWDLYSAELEDFDFGLWALNVKNSSERQRILLDRWTQSLDVQ